MSTVFSASPASLGLNNARTGVGFDTPSLRSRFDGTRGLAALMLAAVVAALVVLADQLISRWTLKTPDSTAPPTSDSPTDPSPASKP